MREYRLILSDKLCVGYIQSRVRIKFLMIEFKSKWEDVSMHPKYDFLSTHTYIYTDSFFNSRRVNVHPKNKHLIRLTRVATISLPIKI